MEPRLVVSSFQRFMHTRSGYLHRVNLLHGSRRPTSCKNMDKASERQNERLISNSKTYVILENVHNKKIGQYHLRKIDRVESKSEQPKKD